MNDHRPSLGIRGEELAAAYLRGLGLKIRHRNFRTRVGEIDLVAELPGGTLVFVEVRSRRAGDGVPPLDSVGRRKQQQVRRTVLAYLDTTGYHQKIDVRIDAIGVVFDDGAATLEHIPNAL